MQYSRFKKVYPSLQIVRITRQRSGQRSPLSKFVNFITDHTSISTLSHFSKVLSTLESEPMIYREVLVSVVIVLSAVI